MIPKNLNKLTTYDVYFGKKFLKTTSFLNLQQVLMILTNLQKLSIYPFFKKSRLYSDVLLKNIVKEIQPIAVIVLLIIFLINYNLALKVLENL